jgi:PKD repeat protein
MKLKNIIISAFVLCVGLIAISGTLRQAGPGSGYTNAPGEGNCTNCHAGSLFTSGANWNNIRLNGNFPGGGYVPDSTYLIEITHRQTGISKFGFQVTPLVKSSNAPAGNIIVSSARVQRYTQNVSGQTREYAGHTSAGNTTVSTDSTRWFFEWKAPSSNLGTVTFHVTVLAANSDFNLTGDQTYAKTFDIGISPNIPTATISASDSAVCSGNNISFQGGGTNNPTSFQWTFTGAQTTSSTLQNPTIRFTSDGNQLAILRTSNSAGTSKADTFNIKVHSAPTALISGNILRIICAGDSTFLSANIASNATYSWLPNGETERQIWGKAAGTYRVVVTDTITGCIANSNQISVVVNAIPQIPTLTSVSGLDSFCKSFIDTLVATTTTADSFIWNVNNVIFRTASNKLPISSSSTIMATVMAKRNPSCVSAPSDALNIFVMKPVTPLNLVGTAVSTDAINLTWNATPGANGFLVSIDSGKNFTNLNQDTAFNISSLQPNTPYQFIVRTLQNTPCNQFDTIIEVTTLPCSNISFEITSNNTLCLGEEYALFVKGLSQFNYSVSFNNGPFGLDTIFSELPTQNGFVEVRIIDSAELSCPAIFRNISYTVTTPIIDTVSKPETINLCSNESYIYKVAEGYSNIDYFVNNALVLSSTNNEFELDGISTGDSIYAIAKNGFCEQRLSSVKFIVTQQPIGGFTFERSYKTYTFTPNQTNADSYVWKFGDGDSSTQEMPVHTYAEMNKEIEVSLSVSNGGLCFANDTQTIVLPDVSSVGLLKLLGLNIYPNPFLHQINISNSGQAPFKYELHSALGQKVLEGNSNDADTRLNAVNLANGMYLLKIISGTDVVVINLIKR